MRNHNEPGCISVSSKHCAGCHYATPTKENCVIAAHCVMFDMPIYSNEIFDQHSDLRILCQQHGDYFTSALSELTQTELYDWQILHENKSSHEDKRRVYTVAELIRVAIGLITLLASLYQLFM